MRREERASVPDSVSREGLALIDGEERRVNLDEVMEKLGVHWTIRFHRDDFEDAEHMLEWLGTLVHFNLGGTIHQVGQRYALVPILGQRLGMPPLVDYTQARIVRCVRLLSEVSYDKIKEDDFRYSLPGISNLSELKSAMCERYCRVRDLTEEEVHTMSITLTKVQLV